MNYVSDLAAILILNAAYNKVTKGLSQLKIA
jgi:hypothetical protein